MTIQLKFSDATALGPVDLIPGEAAVYSEPGIIRLWIGDVNGTPIPIIDTGTGYLPTIGGMMTGPLVMNNTPVNFLDSNGDQRLGVSVGAGGASLQPSLAGGGPGAPLVWDEATDAWYIGSVGAAGAVTTKAIGDAIYLPFSGGTLTGLLTLSGAPTQPLHAATKQYVDGQVGGRLTQAQADLRYLQLSGGTLTGALQLAGNPTQNLHAAPKQYVDAQVSTRLPLTGGTLTGPLVLPGMPTLASQAANKGYVDQQDALKLSLTGGTMTGPLILAGPPSAANGAATKGYVDSTVGSYVLKSGDTMTGPLNVSISPTQPAHATSKQYVDGKVAKSGDTMTGPLILHADPTAALGAATKQYVDAVQTNANSRMRWLGDWAAGTYVQNDVVQDGDFLFVVSATSTTEKPDNGNNPPDPADWDILSSGGGSPTEVGDIPPAQPLQGDLWFCTVEPVGLFVWYDDGDTAQWVQANGAAGEDQLLQTFLPMDGSGAMTGNLILNDGFAARSTDYNDGRYAPLTRSISAGTGLSGGGSLASNRTISLDTTYADDRYYRRVTGTLDIGASNIRLGSTDGRIYFGSSGDDDYICCASTDGTYRFFYNGVECARFGPHSSETRLQGAADDTTSGSGDCAISSSGVVQRSTSMGRFKTDLLPVPAGLTKLLNPVSYRSLHKADEGKGRFMGLVAEEVWEAIPEATKEENYDMRAVVAALIADLKDALTRIETLEGAS